MSPLTMLRSGFWANSVSSRLSVVISSGILIITSLGFLSLWICTSSLSPHFSLMSFPRISNYSLVFVSVNTFPFLRDLRVLIPTLVSVGLTLDYSNSLIISDVWVSLDVTVILNLVGFPSFPRASE
jgi:hypothetical protein